MKLDLNKETKNSLAAKYSTLAQENETLRTTAQNAVNLANYFAFNLETIEKFIINSPLGKGKFFKTFFFIITNWKVVAQLLEDIVNTIKEWRDKVEELRAAAQANQDVPTQPADETV